MLRTLWVLIALAPFVWVLSIGFVSRDAGPLAVWLGLPRWAAYSIATAMGGLGMIGVIANIYLHLLRHRIFRMLHGSLKGFSFVSGIPVVSGWLIAIAIPFCPREPVLFIVAVVLMLADPGGFHWFVVNTWGYDECWNDRHKSGAEH